MNSIPNFPDQESANRYTEIFGRKLNGQHSLMSAVADKYFGKPEGGIPVEHLGFLVELTNALMNATYPEWWDAQYVDKEEEEEETPCSTGQCPV